MINTYKGVKSAFSYDSRDRDIESLGGGNSNMGASMRVSTDSLQGVTEISKSPKPHKGHGKKIALEWSIENEKILVEWCDIAQCYKWLNTRAHNKYSYMHAWFTIPVITLSTISGTASFAQASIPLEYQPFAPMIIGTINIAVGVLSTVQQYLKISELNESHRVSAIAWDKYARNIRIELAKSPKERLDADIFIKHSRNEFDRLMETSPSIHPNVVAEFMRTFTGSMTSKQKLQAKVLKSQRFEMLKKPDICDVIVSSDENRHHWYRESVISEYQILSPQINSSPVPSVCGVEPQNDIDSVLSKREDELIRRERELRERLAAYEQEKTEDKKAEKQSEPYTEEEDWGIPTAPPIADTAASDFAAESVHESDPVDNATLGSESVSIQNVKMVFNKMTSGSDTNSEESDLDFGYELETNSSEDVEL